MARAQETGKNDPSDPFLRLANVWRKRAAENRRLYADEARAHMIESMAAELELAVRELHEMQLTYAETAVILDCSYGTIKNKVAAGEFQNIGSRSEPRIALSQIVAGIRATAAGMALVETRLNSEMGAKAPGTTAARQRARDRFRHPQ